MFHSIRKPMLERMQFLEKLDQQDRADGTTRMSRLRQIPPETGQFLALMLAEAPAGEVIEIGTSAGYSTLWLALACETHQRNLTTYEVLPEKITLARETFSLAEVELTVTLVQGDACQYLSKMDNIAFCFLDAEKEVYQECYETVLPKLVKGGLLIADNAINHQATLQPMLDMALADERVDAMILPVGKGELVCLKN
ncbi:MAG TPA: methyltransferase [Anaerolineaceae bacterium]|nr:methyltransferase [Anaerolineaceae bacterium]